jgi:hypothetical protein
MSKTPTYGWRIWESEARKMEEQAFKLDEEAHSFPVNLRLFLDATKLSRKSAEYHKIAMQTTHSSFFRSISAANYNIAIGNSFKSLGNFFYYSEQPTRAAKFFERATCQYALSDSQIPKSLSNYSSVIRDSIAHQIELQALVADCQGKDAKVRNDWNEALNHFRRDKEILLRLEKLEGGYAQSINKKALVESAEREIQVCQVMLSLREKNFPQALEYAESALAAADKAFKEDQEWFGYQKALRLTIFLIDSLKNYAKLAKYVEMAKVAKDKFKKFLEDTDSCLDNLASYKFEREVESYLRRELQYTHSFCGYKPPYLLRQIDVFASKGDLKTTITICECKLRLKHKPIDIEEIERFSELAYAFRKHENKKAGKEGRRLTIYAWLVTNADSAKKEAVTLAKKNKIEIKHAEIPKGRERLTKDTSWQVSNIYDLQ